MADPYIGEIRMFAGTFAPFSWEFCDGRQLAISQYEALFNLIGTTYGGDGQDTFNLPNLCGRVPVHRGQAPGISQNYQLGEQFGVEEVTLTTPADPDALARAAGLAGRWHDRAARGRRAGERAGRGGLRRRRAGHARSRPPASTPLGGSQPHANMPPYATVRYIICLDGIYPIPSP